MGLAGNDTIWLDVDAAGHGWWIDSTPLDDDEFLNAGSDAGGLEGMDLLTVVMHELGHVFGFSEHTDSENGLMFSGLQAGVRRTVLDPHAVHSCLDTAHFPVSMIVTPLQFPIGADLRQF